MTPDEKNEVQQMIEMALARDFYTKKLGDTPTDAQQLTPKGYVDSVISGSSSSVASSLNILSSVVTGLNQTQFTQTLVSGETISTSDAVVIGLTETSPTVAVGPSLSSDNLTTDNILSGNNLFGQTYTATKAFLRQVTLPLHVGGRGSWIFTLSVQGTAGGFPDGTQLGSATYSFSNNTDAGVDTTGTFTFSTPISWTPGTLYAFVVNVSNTTNNPSWYYTGSDPYTGGQKIEKTAGTWANHSPVGFESAFTSYETATFTGYIYRANSTLNDPRANNFIGFANSSVATLSSVLVVVDGVAVLSGLSQGATYYLSNSNGQIASTAGSQSRKIGIALSSTKLLMKHDNP